MQWSENYEIRARRLWELLLSVFPSGETTSVSGEPILVAKEGTASNLISRSYIKVLMTLVGLLFR